MFKSPIAGGIALGLGTTCIWAIPLALAILTKAGPVGFIGGVIAVLIAAAAIAEFRARKRKKVD